VAGILDGGYAEITTGMGEELQQIRTGTAPTV